MYSLLSRICLLSKSTLNYLKPGRGFFTFLFFLVLSGVFWLFTALNETYDREVAFPVVLEGVPKNVVVTTGLSDTLKVTLRDKGFALASYIYGSKVQPVSINFSTYLRSTEKGVVTFAELQKLIKLQLFASTAIVSIKPERLEYICTMGKPRSVNVRINGDIVPADNYYLAHTQIVPQRVTIYASQYLLDSIKYVLTERLDIRDFTDTLVQEVQLLPIKGVRMNPDKVTIKIYPDILTEETVEIPVSTINVPAGMQLRTFPARVKVKFNIGVSDYRQTNTDQFRVEADYNAIVSGSEKCPIRIVQKPRGVTKAVTEVTEVDYLIEN